MPFPESNPNPLLNYTKEGAKQQAMMVQRIVEEKLKRDFFIDLIYKEIERSVPTTSTSHLDQSQKKKTLEDIRRAKAVISHFVYEYCGRLILINPETRQPAFMTDSMGKELVIFSIDQFKYDLGLVSGKYLMSTGQHFLDIARLAEARNLRNPRFDKWYRNPLNIKQNKSTGQVLKQTGKGLSHVFKFLASTPVAIFEMLFMDPFTLNASILSEDEFEKRVVEVLINFCNNDRYDQK